jgi:hypothetical protein
MSTRWAEAAIGELADEKRPSGKHACNLGA